MIPRLGSCDPSATAEVRFYTAGQMPGTELSSDVASLALSSGGVFAQELATAVQHLGGAWLPSLRVVFAPEPHPTVAAGVTSYGQTEVYTGSETFSHEVTHALLHSRGSHNAHVLPVWLHEGLAEMMEGTIRPQAGDGGRDDFNAALKSNQGQRDSCRVGTLPDDQNDARDMLYGTSPYLLNMHFALLRATTPDQDFWSYWSAYTQAGHGGTTMLTPGEYMDQSVPGFYGEYNGPGGAGPNCPGVPILALGDVSYSPVDEPKGQDQDAVAAWLDGDGVLELSQVQQSRRPGDPSPGPVNWKEFSQVPYVLGSAPLFADDIYSFSSELHPHPLFEDFGAKRVPIANPSRADYALERFSVLRSGSATIPLEIDPNAIWVGETMIEPFPAVVRLYQGAAFTIDDRPEVGERRLVCGPYPADVHPRPGHPRATRPPIQPACTGRSALGRIL